jgi:hypothetical protein
MPQNDKKVVYFTNPSGEIVLDDLGCQFGGKKQSGTSFILKSVVMIVGFDSCLLLVYIYINIKSDNSHMHEHESRWADDMIVCRHEIS